VGGGLRAQAEKGNNQWQCHLRVVDSAGLGRLKVGGSYETGRTLPTENSRLPQLIRTLTSDPSGCLETVTFTSTSLSKQRVIWACELARTTTTVALNS
jgi:hypothetical protein